MQLYLCTASFTFNFFSKCILNLFAGSSFLKESGISFIGSEKLFTTDCAENVILQPSNKIALNPNNELKIFKNQIEKEDVSFSTAAGLKLSVSEKSLNKARAFLDECERDITLHSIGAPKNCSTPNSFTTRFSRAQKDETFKIEKPKKLTENLDIRFTTCLGQEVNFSENALEKVKFLMGSCSENQLEGSPAKETLSNQAEKLNKFKEQKYNAPAFCGFSTASGIKVSVSEKSLNKAKKLIAECDKEQETMGSLNRTENSFSSDLVRTSTPKITTNESTKEPCRFNKSDDVSENSFKKEICKEMRVANEVQDKEKKSNADETFITNFAKDSISCKNSRFSANKDFNFKTVPDTEESISRRNSPDKPKTLIANCEENELLQNYCQSDGVASCTRNKLSFVDNFTIGFSTGSGKRIEITNEALERARKLMSSCDEILEESNTSGKAGFEFIVPLPKEGGVEACDSVICDTAVSKCQETNYVSGNQNSSCSFFGVEENSVNSESAGSQITVPDKYKDTVVSESKLKLAVSAIMKNGFSKEIETNFFEISENEKGLISEPVHNIVLTHPDDNTQEKIKRKLLYEDQSNTQMKKQIRIFSPPFKDSCRKTGIKRVFKDASLPSKRMKYLNVEEILDGQDENTLGLKDKKSLARLNQEKIIKEKQKIKPLMGSLLMKKSAKQISFREAVGNTSPEDYFKDDNCLKICDASAFKFSGSALFG